MNKSNWQWICPTAKDPQKRAVYRNIIEELQKGTAISEIAKEYGITRQTVYRIKKDYEQFNYLVVFIQSIIDGLKKYIKSILIFYHHSKHGTTNLWIFHNSKLWI